MSPLTFSTLFNSGSGMSLLSLSSIRTSRLFLQRVNESVAAAAAAAFNSAVAT